jgi:sugar phosphate isomerase/epimerase
MLLGYNTNGLAHHRLLDALDLLAETGYRSVGLTLDAGALDPYSDPAALRDQIHAVRRRLDDLGLARVVETGARYLLNPRHKHDPTLMDPDPARRAVRVEFLCRAIEIAEALAAPVVSLWSGILSEEIPEDQAFDRLSDSLRPVIKAAEARGVTLGFEPEPGMFIDNLARFDHLDRRIAHPLFQLTLDIGHVHCNENGSIADHIHAWASRIVNVHIEDMVRGVHDHLPFGSGTIDFPPVIDALRRVGYDGGLHVELSRDSHRAVDAVRSSARFLSPLMRTG